MQTMTENPNSDIKANRSRAEGPLRSVALSLLLICIMLWVIFSFVIGIFTAESIDMSPSVQPGDLLIYSRLPGSYSSGGLVIFDLNGEEAIGRVEGCPGDRLDLIPDSYEDNVLGENQYYIAFDNNEMAGSKADVFEASNIKGECLILIRRQWL